MSRPTRLQSHALPLTGAGEDRREDETATVFGSTGLGDDIVELDCFHWRRSRANLSHLLRLFPDVKAINRSADVSRNEWEIDIGRC